MKNWRHSKENFSRFVPHLEVILEHFRQAKPLRLTPHPFNPDAYCHRIRDALHAFAQHDYPAPFTLEDCFAAFELFRQGGTWIFSEESGFVYVGPRKRSMLHLRAPVQSSDGTKLRAQVFDGADTELLESLCVMLNRELLEGPLQFANLSGELVNQLQMRFPNVVFDQTSETEWTLI